MSRTRRGGQSRRAIAMEKQATADAKTEIEEAALRAEAAASGREPTVVDQPAVAEQSVEPSPEPITPTFAQESTTDPPAPAEVPEEEAPADSPPPGMETEEASPLD